MNCPVCSKTLRHVNSFSNDLKCSFMGSNHLLYVLDGKYALDLYDTGYGLRSNEANPFKAATSISRHHKLIITFNKFVPVEESFELLKRYMRLGAFS